MNRLFPRVVSAAVAGSALGLGFLFLLPGVGCSPNNDVKPGAPVLTTFSIVDPSSGTFTSITKDATDCATDVTDGGDCDPDNTPVCRYMAKSYCHCDMKADGDSTILPEMPKTNGTATCTYPPTAFVFATFDRLLDTTPLDPDGGQSGLVTFMADPAPTTTVDTAVNYIPNGTDRGLVFSPAQTGVPLGPSLYIVETPAAPAGAAVTLSLLATKVRAKDGKTGFVGEGGFLIAGALTYQTQGLSASITVPQPGADAGTSVPPDASAVTIGFNNTVDATVADHIHVMVGATAFTAVNVDTSALPTVTITPTSTWTPSTTFKVVVDAAAADVTGSKLGADQSATFTTSAM